MVAAGCADNDLPQPKAAAAAQMDTTPTQHPAAAPLNDDELRVTLLGTGSPLPSTSRAGMSTLVQTNKLNLVIDAGRGVTTRLHQAGVSLGQIDGVFLTHFHSDHVSGLADLWMTGYIPPLGGRQEALSLYGPEGVGNIAEGLTSAFKNDADVRVADGEVKPEATGLSATEFTHEGVVFDQDGVRVTMFDVQHDPKGAIKPSVGYRVDFGEHSVLISGDTIPVDNIVKYGSNVDVMIHEVAEFEDTSALPTVYAHHTNPRQAGQIFKTAAPQMAVYSHIVNGTIGIPGVSNEKLVERTRENYDGPLTVGEDLMSFLISGTGIEVHHPSNI